ncbi:MAG TPA: HAD-IA family hydrolase [Rhodocyclaceae bacterium]|nr:HAD-IA family hydrolase [Rhodocyclaceae bacterium]
MAKRFDLIVFDWDGTLMDSAAIIVSSVQAAARDLGLESPSDERARHIIGLGLDDALRYVLPNLPHERYGELAARYRHHYLSQDHVLSLFSGVEEMLDSLRDAGYWLAVATGKSRLGLDRALEVSGLGSYFHSTRCADECFSKPHPQMLEELMDEFGVDGDGALMIGDTSHDVQMAHNARVAAVAVTYGAHPRSGLEALLPLGCVDTVEELVAWLKQNG